MDRKTVHRIAAAVAFTMAATVLGGVASTWGNLELPEPSGAFVVGKTSLTLVDDARPEPMTSDPADTRSVPIVAWYPAEPDTGKAGAYIEDLDAVSAALTASGEVGPAELVGLGLVRDSALLNADVATDQAAYPVVILSPGNATNVDFYATVAQDLASHGYVVLGVNHPFQVGATRLADGEIAPYSGDGPAPGTAAAAQFIQDRIGERVDDIRFILDALPGILADDSLVGGRLDLDSIAVVGHSNGGVAAASTCQLDDRVTACVNIDGQSEHGPFGSESPDGDWGFLFLTKETQVHPAIGDRFEARGAGTYRVVIPGAAHDSFSDASLFEPALLPFERTIDHVLSASAQTVVAFLDSQLSGASGSVFDDLSLHTDLYINAYPLEGKPPLPKAG